MTATLAGREAIVFTGCGWNTYNVPERVAIALGRAGWRVVFCENPASYLRRSELATGELETGVTGFQPRSLGYRLNVLPFARRWQTKHLLMQVLRGAREVGLERPILIYSQGHWLAELAREAHERGHFLVYVCQDHLETDVLRALAAPADLVLVIPRTMYHKLRAEFGQKVQQIPEFGPDFSLAADAAAKPPAASQLSSIPRPRLAYFGPPAKRLNARVVGDMLKAHPEWHLLTSGPLAGIKLPNLHDIGWMDPAELPAMTAEIDVGFMPYDCSRDHNLHCVPLKLYDFFAAGLPVVSTPLIHLWEYGDLVYLGDTAEELAEGVRKALAEPPSDPRCEERRRIARAHSLDTMSSLLSDLLLKRQFDLRIGRSSS